MAALHNRQQQGENITIADCQNEFAEIVQEAINEAMGKRSRYPMNLERRFDALLEDLQKLSENYKSNHPDESQENG